MKSSTIIRSVRHHRTSRRLAFTAILLCLAILTACRADRTGQPSEDQPPAEEETSIMPSGEEETGGGYQLEAHRLFPYNGDRLCVYERITDPEEEPDPDKDYAAVLLFDYQSETFLRMDLPGYMLYSGISPSAPVLWNGKVLTVEGRAFRCTAYELFEDEAPSRIFLSDPQNGKTAVIETDPEYYLFESTVWEIPGDDSHFLITGSRGRGLETLLLKISLADGSVEDLGEYSDPGLNDPEKSAFYLSWQEADGYTYAYHQSGVPYDQALYRKATGSADDYEQIVEDCYPDDYYSPYEDFRILGNTVYYLGVSNTLESPMIFCCDLGSGELEQRAQDAGEPRLPVDRYGTKLIVADSAGRYGVPLAPEDIGIIEEDDYMVSGSAARYFSERTG